MNRLAIRTIIKDIITIVKNNDVGFFKLPEDINKKPLYDFINTDQKYDIELTIKISKKIDTFTLNGNYIPDEEIIELYLIYNPNNKNLYNLIGELNEVITHEMTHQKQHYTNEFNLNIKKPTVAFKYYTQKHEIPAQYNGFKRLSKIAKESFNKVVNDWFVKNRQFHYLNKKEEEKVINLIINHYICQK